MTARKLLARLFYRRLVVYEARLDAPRHRCECKLPLRFEVLGRNQVADHHALVPDIDPALVARRMSAGDRCHAARLHGRVVAVRWVAFRDVQLTRAGLVLPVSHDDAYLYGAYTDARWRRQGVAAALTEHILHRLESEGRRRALSAWIPENAAGRSLHPSRGRPIALVRVVRVGPWSVSLRPKPPEARARFRRQRAARRATPGLGAAGS